jgi:hypothetical protein
LGEQAEKASTHDREGFVARIGALGTLAAVLLPVAGVLARLVAYSTSPIAAGVPFDLAWAAPLPALVITGIAGLVVGALPTLALVPFLIRMGRKDPSPNPRAAARVRLIGGLVLVAWVVVMPAWPVALAVLVFAAVGDIMVRIQMARAGAWVASQAWLTVLTVMTLGAILWGLVGVVVGAEAFDFRFRTEAAGVIHDGRYVELGDSGTELILQDCSRPADPATKVDRNLVLVSRLSTHQSGPGPNLWDVLHGHHVAGLGFKSPC